MTYAAYQDRQLNPEPPESRPLPGVLLVPWAGFWPHDTVEALGDCGDIPYEVVLHQLPLDVTNRPPETEAYYECLCEHWQRCGSEYRDLIIVEHDVIPTKAIIDQFTRCPNSWCSNPIWTSQERHVHTLGCVRFRGMLMNRHPDFMRVAGHRYCGGFEPRHWKRMDSRVSDEMHERHLTLCEHAPPAQHLHRYPDNPDPLEVG